MKTKGKLIMRATRLLVALAMALSTTGCLVLSLHPLATKKDPVFVPDLLGTWVGRVGKEESTIIFQKSAGQAYAVTYCLQEGEPAQLYAQAVPLGKFLFLDTYPANAPDTGNTLSALHLFPTHLIFRIQIAGDVLHIATLDVDKVFELRHEWSESGGSTLLTASTHELQQFVLKHAEDAFTDVGEWHRQKEGGQK